MYHPNGTANAFNINAPNATMEDFLVTGGFSHGGVLMCDYDGVMTGR